ncbi:hypothetical protein QJS10_CPB17g01593 [Acorus calamus]|uniref:Uncharacterized protein n=1 Tax=Acorus calamus TaxID=4465 RepID=A0AAV9CVS6_ACOCL|nr:hypothetical protein QJS10_CPB17g01593 [Acorus calamus]
MIGSNNVIGIGGCEGNSIEVAKGGGGGEGLFEGKGGEEVGLMEVDLRGPCVEDKTFVTVHSISRRSYVSNEVTNKRRRRREGGIDREGRAGREVVDGGW